MDTRGILQTQFVRPLDWLRLNQCNFYIESTEKFSRFCLRTRGSRPLENRSKQLFLQNFKRRFRYLARHGRCDVYCGARETVGESSVSSGCWGEDSDHKNEWARRTPTYVAPIRFFRKPKDFIQGILCPAPHPAHATRAQVKE